MGEKINWGILGAANIAYKKAIPGIIKANNTTLGAIASSNIAKLKKFNDAFHFRKSYLTYDELLEDKAIDAVYIPVPNHLHFEWTKKAVKAGKHVLCEKPMVLSIREVEELIKLKNSSGKLICEGFMVRYHPRWHELKTRIDAGEFGQLSLIQSAFTYDNQDPKNIRNAYQKGGGSMWDIGCYPVHISRYLFGKEPTSVFSTFKYNKNFKVDVLASGVLEFGDQHSIFQVGTSFFRSQYVRLVTSRCSIDIPMPFNPAEESDSYYIVHNDSDPDIDSVKFTQPLTDQFALQFEHFSNAILNNTQPMVSLEDTLNNTKVLLGLFDSGKTGSTVKLK